MTNKGNLNFFVPINVSDVCHKWFLKTDVINYKDTIMQSILFEICLPIAFEIRKWENFGYQSLISLNIWYCYCLFKFHMTNGLPAYHPLKDVSQWITCSCCYASWLFVRICHHNHWYTNVYFSYRNRIIMFSCDSVVWNAGKVVLINEHFTCWLN